MDPQSTEGPFDQHLVAEMPVMYLTTRAEDGRVILADCNARFAHRLGYAPEELVGSPLADVYAPESAEALLREGGGFARALRDEYTTEERTLVHRDGSYVHVVVRAVPRYDEAGSLVGTRALLIDVTDRRRERERFETFLEHSTDVITVVDGSLTIRYQSPAVTEVLGYEEADLVGERALEYIHPDDREGAWEVFSSAVESPDRTTDRFEYRFRHADGSWVWLETVGSNHTNSAVEGYVLSSRDVTERRQREQYLRVLNRILRHNVRNDLNLIHGHAALLAEALADGVAESLSDGGSAALADPVESARTIERTAERWIGLTEKASRVEQLFEGGDGDLLRPAADVVRNACRRVRNDHPEADVSIDVYLDGDRTVPVRVGPAITELCENAVEHAGTDEPSVWVEVCRTGADDCDGRGAADDGADGIEIRVADEGPGIPEGERAVFRMAEETPLEHGSGIGLWLVRLVVTREGGEVTVEDNDPVGSVVTVTLPTR